MGKKARERRDKHEIVSAIKTARIYDLLLVATAENVRHSLLAAELIDASEVTNQLSSDLMSDFQLDPESWYIKLAKNIAPPFKTFTLVANNVAVHEADPLDYAISVQVSDINTGDGKSSPDAEDRWCLSISTVAFDRHSLILKQVEYASEVWVTNNGEYSGSFLFRLGKNAAGIDAFIPLGEDEEVDLFPSLLAMAAQGCVLHTLSFLNCQNIELVESADPGELSKLYREKMDIPYIRYKTLAVKPFGKKRDIDRASKDYQGLMPLHVRRGNFATYTDDAPLFGRYTGTFWRPSTTVGEEKRGIVVKDYKVLAE